MSSDESESDPLGEEQSSVMEFEIPLPDIPRPTSTNSDRTSRHTELAKLLGLPEDLANLQHIFSTVASLCDPYTQPEENDDIVLSVDYIADLVIALSYTNIKHSRFAPSSAPDEVQEPEVQSYKFDLSLAFFTILQSILRELNCDDEENLKYVDNSEHNWVANTYKWTPLRLYAHGPMYYKLCYRMATVLLYALYKLFIPEDGSEYNLAMNPYLFYFVKTWKCQTNVILLGLEIDRRLEEKSITDDNGNYGTPQLIHLTLKGSSAIRYICAWVLNQNPSSKSFDEDVVKADIRDTEYDLKHESLLNFMHPLARKKIDGGALSVDIRLIAIALLSVSAEYPSVPSSQIEDDQSGENFRTGTASEVGDILLDLEFQDRFDEDIRYIFHYELDDGDPDFDEEYEDEEDEEGDEENENCNNNNNKNNNNNHDTNTNTTTTTNNNNEFKIKEAGSESELANDTQDLKLNENNLNTKTSLPKNHEKASFDGDKPTENTIFSAVRCTDDPDAIDFDENGKDWRDIPRGDNIELKEEYKKLISDNKPDFFYNTWEEFQEAFKKAMRVNAVDENGQKLLYTVIRAVAQDADGIKQNITPEKIESLFVSVADEVDVINILEENYKSHQLTPIHEVTKWELLLHNNKSLACAMFDEMMMCKGYRRILIWYLTHVVNLCPNLINYAFELVKGLRGNCRLYGFSRKGTSLVLSPVEQSMLIDEFISNASFYLSQSSQPDSAAGAKPVAIKTAMVLCLMINSLIDNKIIDIDAGKEGHEDAYDYSHNLQIFLISWIGILPTARKLYFRIKNAKTNTKDEENDALEADNIQADSCKILDKNIDDANAQQELVDALNKVEAWDAANYFRNNPDKLLAVKNFTNRMETNFKWIFCSSRADEEYVNKNIGEKPQLVELHNDFRIFLNNFNAWSKMEFFAQELFVGLDSLIRLGKIITIDEEDGEEERLQDYEAFGQETINIQENEFNDNFLDGLGEFHEKESDSKSKKKKKKKKGKKKK